MRKAIFLSLIIIPTLLSAQVYRSIFGKDSTKWFIATLMFDYTRTDSVIQIRDTIINGKKWKMAEPEGNFFHGGLFLEDTLQGKVWYRNQNSNDSTGKLIFDFSLSVGDSFNINNGWKTYTSDEKKVDSVYFVNGRKHIQFKGTIGLGFSFERMTFIEGLGSNIGLIYKDTTQINRTTYLLCAYKDGIQTYANSRFQGNCRLEIMTLPSIDENKEIIVYPTLFTETIFIKHTGISKFNSVKIYNTEGSEVFHAGFRSSYHLGFLKKGMYVMMFIDSNGRGYSKKIMKQ